MYLFLLIKILIVMLFTNFSTTSANETATVSANVTLTLDVADTPEKRAWGLMGVADLAKDHGMLFIYNPPWQASIWMFNVNIDLSIAFIDEQNIIRELHDAKAFPAMLGPQHRIKNVYELSKLSQNDPVVRFFIERSIHSKTPVKYILEVNKGWFETNKIKTGDVVEWKLDQHKAIIWPANTITLKSGVLVTCHRFVSA